MIHDIYFVARRWRIIHLLGISRLRERYARSKFGQLWLSVSNLVLILVTGLVWSLIWKMPLDEYLPYVGVGHVVYLFISQTLNESTGVFVADSRYYLNERTPFMMSIFSHLYRSFLIFIHNIPLIFILVLWSDSAYVQFNVVFLFGFFFLLSFLFFWSYVIASIATRFRDLVQLFGLIFQLAFLITPVMWKLSFVPIEYQNYFMINPFAAFLEVIRNPLIGLPVINSAYISALVWTLLGIIFMIIVYKRFDKKIIFWI